MTSQMHAYRCVAHVLHELQHCSGPMQGMHKVAFQAIFPEHPGHWEPVDVPAANQDDRPWFMLGQGLSATVACWQDQSLGWA